MEKIRKIFLCILISGVSLNMFAQGNAPIQLSLHRACRLAVDSNLQIINARIEIQKTHYQEQETKSKLYPTLNGYSNFNYNYAISQMVIPGEIFGETGEIPVQIGTKYDWSSGFDASISLVNLSNLTAIKLAKSMKAMSALTLEQKKEEILYQVHQVYFLCQATNAQITYLDKNMENTNRLLEILDNQIKNEIARRIDYSNVTVTKNNLENQIENLEKLEEQQKNLLKYILGLDIKIPIELTDSLTNDGSQNYSLPDFSVGIDVILIDNQLDIALLNKKSTSQEYLPTLSAFSQFYYQSQQNKFNFFDGKNRFSQVGVVGLSLNIPIFDGFEKQNKIRQYNSEIAQLQNTRNNTINELQKDYANAIVEYNNSLKSIQRQQDNIKVAEENYTISLQQYKQQRLLLADLLLAENSLTEARLSYIDALLQLRNAELELKKLNNQLSE